MAEHIGWTISEDERAHSVLASGEDSPWARWIPLAWQSLADPTGLHTPPAIPAIMRDGRDDLENGRHAELLAWWTPLFHLTMYGLGWTRPDIGLARWDNLGRPTDDPILRLIDRWWGRHFEDYLASAAEPKLSPYFPSLNLVDAKNSEGSCEFIEDRYRMKRQDPAWSTVWRAGLPGMHMFGHIDSPVRESRTISTQVVRDRKPLGSTLPKAALIVNQYEGWYRELVKADLTESRPGTTWRTDVFCKPLGWLGEYRWSRETHHWFTGRHRWHTLGH